MVEFGIFLLNLSRCEDLDVDQHLCHRKGLVVPLVPQSDLSQTVPHISQPHGSLSDNYLLAKFIHLVGEMQLITTLISACMHDAYSFSVTKQPF